MAGAIRLPLQVTALVFEERSHRNILLITNLVLAMSPILRNGKLRRHFSKKDLKMFNSTILMDVAER